MKLKLQSLNNQYQSMTVKSADNPSALFVPTHSLKSPGSTPYVIS